MFSLSLQGKVYNQKAKAAGTGRREELGAKVNLSARSVVTVPFLTAPTGGPCGKAALRAV